VVLWETKVAKVEGAQAWGPKMKVWKAVIPEEEVVQVRVVPAVAEVIWAALVVAKVECKSHTRTKVAQANVNNALFLQGVIIYISL
jgi:hypothetical protein